MNNKGKKGKTGKKSPRPSHSGRPVSVKKTSSGSSRRKKKSLRKKNPIKILQRIVLICIIVIVAFAAWIIINRASENGWSIGDFLHNSDTMISDAEQSGTDNADSSGGPEQWQAEGAPFIDVELLTPNPYSRSQEKTDKITGIVIHYTANPGATAIGNRNYFEGLKDSHETKASSNFVVGLNGEIVQCIPTWEVAYASNDRNYDTVSIECCHPDATGKFNDATYRSMVQLTAWLCLKFNLTEEDVIRHYDVTGKICPKYFVENEGAWDQFRKDVKAAMAMNKNPE